MCHSKEYVYYIGPLKGSIWNAGSQKCSKITWKIRGWMEEMPQIACKYEAGHQKCCKLHAKRRGRGIHLGTHPMGGGGHGTRDHKYIYIYLCVCVARKITYYPHLPAMDMAKVGGFLSVVNFCTSMLYTNIGYQQVGGPPKVVNVFVPI